MSDVTVNPRTKQVLKHLVQLYIQEGSPIGSKTLAEECSLGLSSATIRNILAELEEGGYIISPHTSSGRIPTAQGYRLFVNTLLTLTPLGNEEVLALKNTLDPDLALSNLLQSASSLLSHLTKLTAVVSFPRRNRIELRQVEFLPLSGNRVLVIIVLNNREVQNRIIYTEELCSAAELQQASNYINLHYAGKSLTAIHKEILLAINEDQAKIAELSLLTREVVNKALLTPSEENNDYLIAGQNNLLNYTNRESDLERLRLIFDAFTQKQHILSLLDQTLKAEGIQIFIGKESGYQVFDDCSIVTTSYAVDGELLGSLGVIGLTRMPYDRVISAVDATAKLLSAALNQS